MDITCYKCNSVLNIASTEHIGRNDQCYQCYSSLRCCRMCRHFDKNSYNECRETMADRITEKEKANFCDYFLIGNSGQDNNTKDDILAAAKALFKK
jgi:hypothetical protein